MKILAVLSLALLCACGKYEYENSADFDSNTDITPKLLSGDDSKKIKDICDALSEKELTASSLVGSNYSFSNTRKECTDSGFNNIADSMVTLTNQNGNLKYVESQTQNLYYFSDIETRSSGVMKQICDNLDRLESPIRNTDGSYLKFSVRNISTGDCVQTTDQICIELERGVASGNKGKPHTREWLRFKMIQPLLGFWTYRKLTTNGGCLEGSYLGRTATQK